MRSNRSVQMVLASGSGFFSEGICKILAGRSNIKIVAEASDPKEVEKCLDKIKPEFLFLDNTTLNLDIGNLLNAIKEKSPNTKVILFGNRTERKLASRNVIYVTEETNSSKLIHTIRRKTRAKDILTKGTIGVTRIKRKLVAK